ncbi:MAG: TonB-dependent receptor [Candidatus Marinimicrobia bacterium]|nr:TonB-dependent receptor [Candidatus Neomarinimicrobiota bacterium]
MKLRYLFFILLIYSLMGQDTFTISGKITDSKTGMALAGANIFEVKSERGTASDAEGQYLLSLTKGAYKLKISYIGYNTMQREIVLNENIVLDFALIPDPISMSRIDVSGIAPDHNVKSTEISVERLSIRQVEQIPVVMGETDIMKTIQLLPGITSIAEGRSGYIVRGSGIDQNLILMDGMPIYYSSHMQGLYSVFNSDAVKGLTVYKGGVPARFGGRGASVLDVQMRDGNIENFQGGLSAGLITSKFSLETPIIKDKFSFFLSGRSTRLSGGSLYDEINDGTQTGGRLNSDKGGGGKNDDGKGSSNSNDFRFFAPNESWFDINGKAIYHINEKQNLNLSFYVGRDSAMTVGLTEWGNRAALLRWENRFANKWLSNTSFIYSKYYTANISGIYRFHSGVSTQSVKQEFSFFPNQNNEVRFGITSEYQDFNHGSLEDATQNDGGKFMPGMQGLESALYIENDQKINDRISLYYGLRNSFYHQLGPGDRFTYDEVSNEPIEAEFFPGKTDIMSSYNSLEPRLAMTYLLSEQNSFKLSYNRNAQYLRLMSLGAEIEWYDIWMPTTKNIKPMLTDQFAMGYFHNFNNNEVKVSAEAYYKILNGAADFEDGLHNYLVDNLEAYVATGQGLAYGFETSIEKPTGKFTGRLSYNYGKSDYKIDVINQGRWYPYRFDKTHSLTMLSNLQLTSNLSVSGTFLYSTGRPVTLPEGYYHISGIPFPYWEGRNKYRLPDYHRLDFGVKYSPNILKRWTRGYKTTIDVSLYNVYDRRNIHTINFNQGQNRLFEQIGQSTYGFMPSININVEF